MIQSKHTPGPWFNHGRDTRGLPCSLVGADTLIARVHSVWYGDVDAEVANANLIAAAPDLYEALANLENDAGQIPDHAWKLVQAALKKARGE